MRRSFSVTFLLFVVACAWGEDVSIPVVKEVEAQPLVSQARRVIDALDFVGEPMGAADLKEFERIAAMEDDKGRSEELQRFLDVRSLLWVEINPESRVKAAPGPAAKELHEQGWRNFLVKVVNSAGVTGELRVASPNAKPVYRRTDNSPEPVVVIEPKDVRERFLDVGMFNSRPLLPTLSGLKVEYRIAQIYCRDAGDREAVLAFDVGQGTQDLGFRAEVPLLFRVKPATKVVFHVRDDDGAPTTAWFVIKDAKGRVFPSPSRRLAPDFFFHPQVYRADGESVLLPPGKYTVKYARGPEYRIQTKEIDVPEGSIHTESFKLARWIHLKQLGWYSGDHHIHAAGCAHYDNPTKGVGPADMFRHCVGEDLNVGSCLSWGPCWYYQKGFFEGKTHDLSLPNYVLRYDVEVSGFPSSHAGHLCLLRLKEDDYPGTTKIEEWPSWDLPVLQWGKEQGGVVGFSHSGWGLACKSSELPNLEMPPFDGIGANEFIVDVVHDACDFISAVDTPIVWELNIWYHTLSCGYRTRISGETDFPCIYDDRVGLGRGYFQLEAPLTFEKWVEALKAGRSYVCDGLSHLVDFKVDDFAVGTGDGVLRLAGPKKARVSAKVAALLGENSEDEECRKIRARGFHEKPYWHVERARIEGTRKVPLEVIVNGKVVERREILADGELRDEVFDIALERSSWMALRIFPSSHTNPVFVEIGGKPIRASKESAQWCRQAVDVCWKAKEKLIRESEKSTAEAAYDVARKAYERIMTESE